MFEDYLENKATYHNLEEHFTKIFEAEIKKLDTKESLFKYPHYNNYCADGTHLMDADPIFSAKSLTTGNILRISIYEEIAEYTIMHNTRGDNDEIAELFLAIKITDIERTKADISDWISLQLSPSN